MNDIIIRPMTDGDIPSVSLLSAELGYQVSLDELFVRYSQISLNNQSNAIYVAEKNYMVVGWVHVYAVRLLESKGYAEVGGLVVSNNHRRQGVGRQLMQVVEQWAIDNNFLNIRLLSGVKRRHEAHLFYKTIDYIESPESIVFKKEL